MSPEKRGSVVTWIVILGGLIAVLVIFWRPLVGWFTGEPADRGATSELSRLTAGPIVVEAALRPDPPEEKGNTLVLALRDVNTGAPIEDANVTVTYMMPAMGAMPEMRGTANVEERGEGRYDARFDLQMGGS